MRSKVVWPESNCRPIEGSATFATDRFRLATAATRMRAVRTRPARAGAVPAWVSVAAAIRRASECGDVAASPVEDEPAPVQCGDGTWSRCRPEDDGTMTSDAGP